MVQLVELLPEIGRVQVRNLGGVGWIPSDQPYLWSDKGLIVFEIVEVAIALHLVIASVWG